MARRRHESVSRLVHSCPGSLSPMPQLFSDPEAVVDDIIRDVGKTLVVGLPLGLGKANHIVNALYARAAGDPSIDLTLFSALTLEKPKPGSLLESRFGSARGRAAVRRLSGSRLCRAAARRQAAAQHQGAGILLPGGQVAARAVRPAALYFGELYPCRFIPARARTQCGAAARRQTRRRRRDPLQPELQHRHHARHHARPQRGPGELQADCTGQFRTAVHAGSGRSAGRASSVRCSTAPPPTFRCSRRRPSRSATPNTRSACTPRAWCATAARCRSASGRSATRWRRD